MNEFEIDYDHLKERYTCIFGSEYVSGDTIASIESVLNIRLPDDFKKISSFFCGGIVGTFMHLAISNGGQADNVVATTQFLRKNVGLPRRFLVIADFNQSFILLDCSNPPCKSQVVWVTSQEMSAMKDSDKWFAIQEWKSYSLFFREMLDSVEQGQ